MLLLNALPVFLGPVGEGDEVAVKEGVAIVVILDVQRTPKPRRHLVHEAEDAAIAAAAKTVEYVISETGAEVFSVFPFHNESEPLAGSLYLQL
jgi:predicted Ser/Thr protein kinase